VGKLRTKKQERDENENYICFGDWTRSGTFCTEKYQKGKSAAFLNVTSA